MGLLQIAKLRALRGRHDYNEIYSERKVAFCEVIVGDARYDLSGLMSHIFIANNEIDGNKIKNAVYIENFIDGYIKRTADVIKAVNLPPEHG